MCVFESLFEWSVHGTGWREELAHISESLNKRPSLSIVYKLFFPREARLAEKGVYQFPLTWMFIHPVANHAASSKGFTLQFLMCLTHTNIETHIFFFQAWG